MQRSHLSSILLILTGIVGLLVNGPLRGQDPVPFEIPEGYVLVDDMVLPEWAVRGDSNYIGTPWTNGVVPYTFDASTTLSNQTAALNAMAEWEAVADVDFVPRTNQANYIRWVNTTANNSLVGMTGGIQDVNIVSWGTKYVLCHELYHALSFKHEQSRPDRDTYVTINWQNISQSACSGGPCDSNFQIANGATTVGAYDFLSIMHYGATAFSTNGLATITCKPAYSQFQSQIGQRTYMTVSDALGLQSRYGAPLSPTLTSLSQTWAEVGSATFTLTLTGTRFFGGSPNSSGVQGTRVRWNGVELPTTYISPTQVSATVSSSLLTTSGCVQVTVDNAYPGGGTSSSRDFTVGPYTTSPTYWNGTSELAHLGYAVAALGDVNGDGLGDVLVGEPDYDGGRGRAWCFSGQDGQELWSRIGGTGYSTGHSVAVAGDINNDGVLDALIGGPGFNSGEGRVDVVSGANGATLRFHIGNTYGAVAGDEFGFSVANAGDLDGNGVDDQIIGSPGRSSDTGRAYAVTISSSTAIFVLSGSNTGDRFGHSVAGGFKINSDSVTDFVVGAPYVDGSGTDRGRIYIYGGQNGTLLASRTGDGDDDHFGISVGMAPSVDGRTGGCFFAGADEVGPGIFGFSAQEGYVRIFVTTVGGGGSLSYDEILTLHGSAAGDRFGHSVCWAGDVDQDGTPDLLVGAPESNSTNPGPGFVRIHSGKTGELLHEEAGSFDHDHFGFAVAGRFNHDDDSIADFIVGSPYYDNGTCTSIGNARIIEPVFPPSIRKMMITEVCWGTPEAVEITNFGDASITLSGWTLQFDDGATKTSSPISATLRVGESLVLSEVGAIIAELPASVQKFEVLPNLTTSSQDLTVTLFDNNNQAIDEVRISSTAGAHAQGSLGGLFRGLAMRTSSTVSSGSVERIWGLDSNAGRDFTEQSQSSLGLENRNSGSRGTDPIALTTVVINEIDTNPDLVEFRLISGGLLGLMSVGDWYVLASAGQGQRQSIIRPWPGTSIISDYFVIGEGAAPSELPPGTSYVNVTNLGYSFPWTNSELDCALYDTYGRLIDIVRATAVDSALVHNHPRSPSAWKDFVGAALRTSNGGDVAFGRDSASTETDSGADFYPIFTRTMGSSNLASTLSGPAGHGDALDARVNETGTGEGLVIILNAGQANAGFKASTIISAGHQGGLGPILGLGGDALTNFALLYNVAPWTSTLDVRGSMRIDLPPATFPANLDADLLFILQNPSGALTHVTKVLEYDS